MSNKFLPFVVENSTPLHMFKTLLSRRKGMKQVLIASTFHLILNEDVKMLRERVKEMPDMALESIYEELIQKFPKYRIQDFLLKRYQSIVTNFPDPAPNKLMLWSDELKEYHRNDRMLFFCAMDAAGKPTGDYTDFPYSVMADEPGIVKILTNVSKYVKFGDNGTEIEFEYRDDLVCFVLYYGLFSAMMEPDKEPETFKASLRKAK